MSASSCAAAQCMSVKAMLPLQCRICCTISLCEKTCEHGIYGHRQQPFGSNRACCRVMSEGGTAHTSPSSSSVESCDAELPWGSVGGPAVSTCRCALWAVEGQYVPVRLACMLRKLCALCSAARLCAASRGTPDSRAPSVGGSPFCTRCGIAEPRVPTAPGRASAGSPPAICGSGADRRRPAVPSLGSAPPVASRSRAARTVGVQCGCEGAGCEGAGSEGAGCEGAGCELARSGPYAGFALSKFAGAALSSKGGRAIGMTLTERCATFWTLEERVLRGSTV